MNGWGGKRTGAGRPIQAGEVKKNRSLKATDAEWELISNFAKIVKYGDKQAAKDFINRNLIKN